jgi:DMSO/TMAO reductase YedYZ molybdopterin-dependent catalytic subunit
MKEAYIAAKERWARKMSGAAKPEVRSTDRLPPGQRQVHNFPVLDLGVKRMILLSNTASRKIVGLEEGYGLEVVDTRIVGTRFGKQS